MGIEISDSLVDSTNDRIRKFGLQDQARVIHGDFMQVDLGPADVVTIYLATDSNEVFVSAEDLEKVLEAERAWCRTTMRRSGVEGKNGGQQRYYPKLKAT